MYWTTNQLIPPKLGCMEYNALVRNHIFICTCGYTLVHYIPYSPASGVLTITCLISQILTCCIVCVILKKLSIEHTRNIIEIEIVVVHYSPWTAVKRARPSPRRARSRRSSTLDCMDSCNRHGLYKLNAKSMPATVLITRIHSRMAL